MSKNRNMKRYGAGAALVVAGVAAGSFLAPIGLASAQDDADTNTSVESTQTDEQVEKEGRYGERGQRHRRGHRGHAEGRQVLLDTLGITQDEMKAAFEADKSIADVAAEQGVALDEVKAALLAEAEAHIDEHVSEGKITEEQAAERKAMLADRIDERLTTAPSERPERHEGRKGMKGHRGMGPGKGELAEFLGLEPTDLRSALEEGKTLADVAAEQGVSEQDLVDHLVDGIEERMNAAVEAGKLDADAAAERLANAEEKVTEMVNADPSEREGRRPGMGRRGKGHFGDRHGGMHDADGETVESGYSA